MLILGLGLKAKFLGLGLGILCPGLELLALGLECSGLVINNNANRHIIYHTTTTVLFYGPFSGTTQVSWCQKRTSGLYGAREDNRGRHTDHPARHHSIRTNQCLPAPVPIFFYRPDALPATQRTASKHGRQLVHSDYREDARVLLNGVICTICIPFNRHII